MIKRQGRPPKSADSRRVETLEIRVTQLEKQSFQDSADILGLPLSAWARKSLRKAAIEELEDAGHQVPFLRHLYERQA